MPGLPKPMRVVSNTSPLLYLHAVKQLPLLEQLYGSVVIPQAVVDELSVGQRQSFDVPDCGAYGWMRIESVPIPRMLTLITNLGAGEAEALALALATDTRHRCRWWISAPHPLFATRAPYGCCRQATHSWCSRCRRGSAPGGSSRVSDRARLGHAWVPGV